MGNWKKGQKNDEVQEMEKEGNNDVQDDIKDANAADKEDEGTSKDDSEASNDSKQSDGCQVLMFKFVDESKENHEKEAELENKDEKKGGTISLEPAGPDDASADSDDDLDVNAGLEKCFNDLENKIASEKDESSDKPEDNKQNDKKEDEDDSNTDAVEVNNDSDEDDV